MTLLLTLPLPHKYLRPNSAPRDWRIKHGITKQAREKAKRETFKLVKEIDCPCWILKGWRLKAYFKTKRWMDISNILASTKAIEDGIADAVGQNDKHFEIFGVERFTDTQNPRLEILLEIETLI